MGSFVFRWDHPAAEVYVTGTFDDWKKTEKLDKVGDRFEKQVALPDASSKIFYKFLVDGEWITDHTAPRETDESGIENNVLTPEQIVRETLPSAAIMSSVAPDSTTAALAAAVPLEKKEETMDKAQEDEKNEKVEKVEEGENSDLPGAFPETPAAEPNDDEAFGVNPLPAAAGAVNPIRLAPGEKLPEEFAAQSTTSNVKLDPESYEKSDTLPGDNPFTISSAAPESTTAALAAGAPIESKVPEVVKESQEKANYSPEASAVPEEVEEKAALEKELLEKVKEAPSTSEGTAGEGTEKTEDIVTPNEAVASVVAAASAAAGAVVAEAVVAKDLATEKTQDILAAAQTFAASAAQQLPDSVKENLPEPVQDAIDATQKEEVREEVSPEVPAEVKESIIASGESPEAAANTEAVEDKKAVETELLSEVKPIDAAANGEPREEISPEVPVTVKESLEASERSPEAAANTEAVEEKKAVETELLQEVKPVEAVAENADKEASVTTEAPAAIAAPETTETPALAVPATTEAPAASVAADTTETPTTEASKPAEQETTTNGNSAKAVVDPATPAKQAETATASSSKTDESPATGEKKKKNRLSAMFGKVKAKLSHKN
ncbi:putative carbohydrate-binding module family 48 protein [Rosellinia necatrix]|uniref:Putative carbohydrate-binding module family 48 protein n=1 Tax=Rosellinia necatrix TaxID=77044 RepID=A0A1S7UMC6_ROSNE|nr:putative carbohydrate-binding module family 48 protein [Rosellinia necatrix]